MIWYFHFSPYKLPLSIIIIIPFKRPSIQFRAELFIRLNERNYLSFIFLIDKWFFISVFFCFCFSSPSFFFFSTHLFWAICRPIVIVEFFIICIYFLGAHAQSNWHTKQIDRKMNIKWILVLINLLIELSWVEIFYYCVSTRVNMHTLTAPMLLANRAEHDEEKKKKPPILNQIKYNIITNRKQFNDQIAYRLKKKKPICTKPNGIVFIFVD